MPAKPNIIKEIFYYSKALLSEVSFEPARESSMVFFRRVLSISSTAEQRLAVEPTFIIAYSLLFTRGLISVFDRIINIFISGIDLYTSRKKDYF